MHGARNCLHPLKPKTRLSGNCPEQDNISFIPLRLYGQVDENEDKIGRPRKEEMGSRSKKILDEPLLSEPDASAVFIDREPAPTQTVHYWSLTQMLERAEALRRIARYGHGSATESVTKYPRHCTMLTFRGHDGVAELHDDFADLYFVLDGRATLVTGGVLVGGLPIDEGEYRGLSIEDGLSRELRIGDVVHVPAGVPHQILVGADRTVTCFVVRIKETA